MNFIINGLRVGVVDGLDDAGDDAGFDVTWRRERTDSLVASDQHLASGSVREDVRTDGVWTERMDSYQGQPNCIFSVSPDGRLVISHSRRFIADEDLHGVFVEPVMRMILHRLGHPSFHAAALVRNGSALLIMGEKGAGKSTLSAALQRQAWSLLADDLVRVQQFDGVWCALPGHRRSKLHEDVLDAFGIAPETLPLRWTMLSGPSEKRLFATPDDGLDMMTRAPIGAVWLMQPRSDERDSAKVETLQGGGAVLTLLANGTPDPVDPGAMPRPALVRAVQGLIRQATVSRITMPDRLDRLIDAAAGLVLAASPGGA